MTLTAGNAAAAFDATLVDANPYAVFAAARDGSRHAIAKVMQAPNFTVDVSCTADTDDGKVLSFGGGSTTAGATYDQGVTFPAGSVREIRFRVTSRTGGSTAASTGGLYVGEYVQSVRGVASSTTSGVEHPQVCTNEPSLLRGYQRTSTGGTIGMYGVVQYRATIAAGGATITAVTNPAGLTVAAFASGAADLTYLGDDAPYQVRYRGGTLSGTITAARGNCLLVDTAGGTDAIQAYDGSGAGTGTDGAPAQPVVGDLELAFEIWPPSYPRLVASSTTTGTANTPGLVCLELDSNLLASATTYAAAHRVEVWVGEAKYDRP